MKTSKKKAEMIKTGTEKEQNWEEELGRVKEDVTNEEDLLYY